jgi:hypothetical protein
MVIEMATTMKAKNSKCDGYMDRWGMIFFFKERERERERERETDIFFLFALNERMCVQVSGEI